MVHIECERSGPPDELRLVEVLAQGGEQRIRNLNRQLRNLRTAVQTADFVATEPNRSRRLAIMGPESGTGSCVR